MSCRAIVQRRARAVLYKPRERLPRTLNHMVSKQYTRDFSELCKKEHEAKEPEEIKPSRDVSLTGSFTDEQNNLISSYYIKENPLR